MAKITPPHPDEIVVLGDTVTVSRRDWFAVAAPHARIPGLWRVDSGYGYRGASVDRRIAFGRKHAMHVLYKVAFNYWPKPHEVE